MKKEDRVRFLKAISMTRVSLPGQSLTEDEEALRCEVFWEQLERYDIELVEEAFKGARRSLKYFPSPSEIIEEIELIKKIDRRFKAEKAERNEIEYQRPSSEEMGKIKEFLKTLNEHLGEKDRFITEGREEIFKERKRLLEEQKKLLGLKS